MLLLLLLLFTLSCLNRRDAITFRTAQHDWAVDDCSTVTGAVSWL
jgi:hypothetical protein